MPLKSRLRDLRRSFCFQGRLICIAWMSALALATSAGGVSGSARQVPPPPSADLEVRLTGPVVVDAGDTITYVVQVVNRGPDAAASVRLTDQLPLSTVFLSATGGGTVSGNTVTWPIITDLPAGGAPQTFVLRVLAAGPPPASNVVNRAFVTATTADPAPGNNSASVSTRVEGGQPTANVSVRKLGPAVAAGGGLIDYSIEVVNAGPGVAQGIRVTDVLPPQVQFISASPGGTQSGGSIVWLAAALQPLRDTLRFQVQVRAPAASQAGPILLTNVATVTTSSTDPDLTDNSSTARTEIPTAPAPPDVSIDKRGPLLASSGDTITYTLVVSNGPGSAATQVVVNDRLPPGGQFISASPPPASVSGGLVTWPTIASLGSSGSVPYSLRFRVPTGPVRLTNTAFVTATVDADPSNNTSAWVTDVGSAPAELSISKVGPQTARRGDTISYSITVKNTGAVAATQVEVADTLPSTFILVAAPGSQGAVGRVVTWPPVPSLAPGDSVRFDLSVRPVVVGTWTNTATVKSPGLPDGRATARTLVVDGPDVAIDKQHVGEVSVGAQAHYRISIQNVGSESTVGAVTVVDTLPAGLTFGSAQGAGWAFAIAAKVVTASHAGPLAPGETAAFDIFVDVDGAARPQVVNVAWASTPGDRNRDNDFDADTVVFGFIDAAVVKSAVGDFLVGRNAAFRFVVTNVGQEPTIGPIVLTDTLPAGIKLLDTSGDDWSVQVTAEGLVATHAAILDPGISATLLATVEVLPGAVPEVRNTAWIDTPGDPIGDANDSSTVVIPISSEPETRLTVAKGSPVTSAVVGDMVPYRVVVGAVGSLPVVDVSLIDRLPFGFRFEPGTVRLNGVPAPDPEGTPGPELRFFLGTIQGGDSVVVTYRVFLGPGSELGDGINRARVVPGGGDPSPEVDHKVDVRQGAFTDEGLIVGKVYLGCDCDEERGQEGEDQVGIPGVRVYLHDGTSALTDAEGQFSFEGLRPRLWVVRVDPRTMPAGARLVRLSNRHARNGGSQRVDLKRGELHRADFAVRNDAGAVRESVTERRRRAEHVEWLREPVDATLADPTVISSGHPRDVVFRPLLETLPDSLPWVQLAPPADSSKAASSTPVAEPVTDSRTDVPVIAMGLVQGRIDFRSLFDAELGAGVVRDRFEDELRTFQTTSDEGDVRAGARGALFLEGDLASGTSLTLRVDSEEDDRARLFRDIRPDDRYPTIGDAADRRFDARSRGRVFGEVRRGASYAMFGDFNTGPGAFGENRSRLLGEYSRALNGALQRYESPTASLSAFASRDRSTQVVDVIPGQGVSGPYLLTRGDGLLNSERVELVTRDRNQPAIVLHSQVLERFLDYSIEPLSGRLLFKWPVPALDPDLNPVEIRVTYEVEGGGDRFWIFGAQGQVRPTDRIELGGSFVHDDAPAATYDLFSANATVALGASTYLIGEFARSDLGGAVGEATRFDLRHASGRLAGRVFWLDSDTAFANPSSPFLGARREVGARGSARLGDATRLIGEWLRTEDAVTDGQRTGGLIALDQRLGDAVSGRVGLRIADESSTPASTLSGETPSETLALGARLDALAGKARFFGEFEQDVRDSEKRRASVGGDYPLFAGARLYARHELLSSLSGPYGLDAGQERNTTLFGITADTRSGQSVFSEYRVKDAFNGREAQAAIGLRNKWLVREGLRLSTSFERLTPLAAAGGPDATAVTGALEMTGDSLWKGHMRGEFYSSAGVDNVLGSLGYARKLDRSWTVLGNSVFSTMIDGDRAFERTRVGFAYRQTDRARWNALTRYEHRYNRETDDSGADVISAAHVFAGHLDYQPNLDVLLRAQWATRLGRDEVAGQRLTTQAHLLGGRGTFDLTCRVDVGVVGRTLFTGGSRGARYGIGAEIGARIAEGLRLAAGYNVFGFEDPQISSADRTDRGFYLQLGFTFDEGLFRGAPAFAPSPSSRCFTGPLTPGPGTPPTPPPPSDSIAGLGLTVFGPNLVLEGDTILYVLVTRVDSGPAAVSVRLDARLPQGTDFVRASRGMRPTTDGHLVWDTSEPLRDIRVDTLVVVPRSGRSFALLEAEVGATNALPDTARTRARLLTEVMRLLPPDGRSDLTVQIIGPDRVFAGDSARYRVIARNRGLAEAGVVTLEARGLAGERVLDVGQGGVLNASTVTWTGLGTLQSGDSLSRTLVFAGTGRPLVVEAHVDTPSPEVTKTNNISRFRSEITHVDPAPINAEVSIGGPGEARVGDVDTLEVVTRNTLGAPVLDVLTVLQVPSNAIVQTASGGARITAETVSWPPIGFLATGGERRDTVIVVHRSAGASVWIATISSSPPDDPRGNRAEHPVSVTGGPDLPDVKVSIVPFGEPVNRVVSFEVVTSATTATTVRDVLVGARWPQGVTLVGGNRGLSPGVEARTGLWPRLEQLAGVGRPGSERRDTIRLRMPRGRRLALPILAFVQASGDADSTNNQGSAVVQIQEVTIVDTVQRTDTVFQTVQRTDTIIDSLSLGQVDTLLVRGVDTIVVRGDTIRVTGVDTIVLGPDTIPGGSVTQILSRADTVFINGPIGPGISVLLWLLVALFTLYMLARWRRYGSPFAPCWRLWPVFRREEINGYIANLRRPANRNYAGIRAIHDRVGGMRCADWVVSEEVMYAYRDVRAWHEIYEIYDSVAPTLQKKSGVTRLFAFALNRDGRGEEAEHVLRSLKERKGPSTFTCGALGRVYKDRFEHAWRCSAGSEESARLCALATDSYREGHAADPSQPYPGLNALTLDEVQEKASSWRDSLLIEVEDALGRRGNDGDYWTEAARMELAVLTMDEKQARDALGRALKTPHVVWQVETTLRNQRLIHDARVQRGIEVPEWTSRIIAALETVMETASADDA